MSTRRSSTTQATSASTQAASASSLDAPRIDLRFHLGWQEYFAAERLLLRHQHWLAPEQYLGLLLVVLGAMLRLIFGFHWYFPVVTGGGLLLLITPLWRRLGLKRRWQREPIQRAEHVVSFSPRGVHYVMGGVESNLIWMYFQHWLESANGFLLVSSQDVIYLIPKRAFADPAALDQFRTLLQSRLPSV